MDEGRGRGRGRGRPRRGHGHGGPDRRPGDAAAADVGQPPAAAAAVSTYLCQLILAVFV